MLYTELHIRVDSFRATMILRWLLFGKKPAGKALRPIACTDSSGSCANRLQIGGGLKKSNFPLSWKKVIFFSSLFRDKSSLEVVKAQHLNSKNAFGARYTPCDECSSGNLTINYKNAVVVDLRSDTLTKPTKGMREAMFSAEVGDDVYAEDPTVKKLEGKAAEIVGMEAAIFVSSGTMGNLIATMNHCNVRGSEAYCGDSAHCLQHEQCGASQIAGVSLQPLRNNPDGTFDISELQSKLRKDRDHEPISKLVLVENTMDGKIVPQDWIDELVIFCKEHNLKLHMDGARLWNASVGSGISAKEIVSGFDSVTFCLSKGLGAPVGSLLCGSKQFIVNARRVRKVLGGGMRQIGILAAAGLVALEDVIPMLHNDHRRASLLASAIEEIQSPVLSVDLSTVQTNMVFVKVDTNVVSATKFTRLLREINDDDENKVVVKCLALNDSFVRFVFYHEITDSELLLAVRKIRHVIKKLNPSL